MKLLTYLVLFLCLNAFAEEVVVLQKNQPAPFEGYLLTKEKAEKVYSLGIDLEFQTKRATLLEEKSNLLLEQNTRNREYIEDLSKRLTEAKSDTIWSKIGFFILGCAVTTAVTFSVSKVMK